MSEATMGASWPRHHKEPQLFVPNVCVPPRQIAVDSTSGVASLTVINRVFMNSPYSWKENLFSLTVSLVLIPALAGCHSSNTGSDPTGRSTSDELVPAPVETVFYTPTDEVFPNPERGFHTGFDLVTQTDAKWVYQQGFTLARTYVRPDDYRETDLPESLLTDLDWGLGAVRSAGIKVILRFTYNFGYEPDASKARILAHIQQLASVLQENGDVIAAMPAGFVGAWGEWHSSTNGLDNPTDGNG